VLLDRRSGGRDARGQFLCHELEVERHVVERILSLVRETDGDALEQAGAVGGALLRILSGCSRDAWNRLPHMAPLAVRHCRLPRQVGATRRALEFLLPNCGRAMRS
jgi:hypothetical protein